MDRMQAPPRRFPAVGGLADFLAAGTSPQRTQQMRGLMEFLQVPDFAKTLDRVSYGEPLTTGRGMTTKLRPETENTLMAALGMTPVGKPAQAGAMALGRAGERVGMAAEKALEAPLQRAYDKGGLSREMLLAMAQGTQSPATVFHGSPHRFQKFDSSKIGTGEGSQAYGQGLYLAENPSVASEYAKMLQKPINSMFAEESLEKINPQLLQKLRAATGSNKYSSDAGRAYIRPNDFNLPPELKKEVLAFKKNSPNLYQVDLPDEQIAKMLDYDNPVDEAIRSKVSKAAMEKFGSGSTGTSGELLYKELVREFKNAGSANPAVDASEFLRAQDVPGIRFLDQGSRGTGKGTSNFVVFPGMEDMLRIEQINNQPVESLFRSLGR